MLKISVVTPSYNQGKFIEKCLQSVRAQQGRFTVEHIVLDNCSTDDTSRILAAFRAVHVCTDIKIFIEPDGGQTAAINKGFSLATGDIVCWINTDEWYVTDAFTQVAEFFETHPNIDVVFGNCDFVNSDYELVKQKREYFFSESMLVYYGCFLPSCATFVRRRVLDDGIFLDPAFKVTMDFDWYVRIAKAGYRFAHLPATLASFTWHESNISSTLFARRKYERRLVQDRYSGVPTPNWLRTLVYSFMRYFWLAVRVTRRAVA